MRRPAEIVEQNRAAIISIAAQHKGRSIAVFGSVARDDDTSTSDIDFLVDFESGSSLFDLMHLQEALAELLECDVDVVSAGALTHRDDHIRKDAIPL